MSRCAPSSSGAASVGTVSCRSSVSRYGIDATLHETGAAAFRSPQNRQRRSGHADLPVAQGLDGQIGTDRGGLAADVVSVKVGEGSSP